MNKKHLKVALLSLMCTSMALSYTSCKDYDDDITNLQGQIDGIKVTLDQLQAKVEGGQVITGVTSTTDGVVITLSDNKSYTISNGKDGAAADVWTIGDDGMWYKNGKKTTYKAIGTDGKDGKDGVDGVNGTNGADGTNGTNGEDGKDGNTIYYYPNPDTGKFDKYENGKKVEGTDIVWRTSSESSMSVALAGTRLTLAGFDAEDPEKTVVINSGVTVGSVAFVPTIVCKDLPYATTDKPFYHIDSYLTEAKYDPTTKNFIAQTGWNKSNAVDLIYRVNPTGATVTEKDKVGFVNRGVISRADDQFGDFTKLLSEKTHAYTEGKLTVSALYNKTEAVAGKHNIVAAQLWQGQDPYVSDYIAVTSEAISPAIVNPKSDPKYATYYDRYKAITSDKAETDEFVKTFVKLTDACNLTLYYDGDGKIDLAEYVELYSLAKKSTLTDLDFDGISYKFFLPENYLADDAQKTNQQWFVDLEGSVLILNSKNLSDKLSEAYGRTPVVRVDAYMTDNAGAEQMVASSYIKVKISKVGETPSEDKTKDPIEMGVAEYKYSELTDNDAIVKNNDGKEAKLSWEYINKNIYGAEGLNSQNFWSASNYGLTNGTQYLVEIAVQQNGKDVVLNANDKTATVGQVFKPNVDGLATEVLFGSGETQTAYVSFKINNKVKTNVTYDNVDGKGAKYTVTITLPSNNLKAHPNYVIKEVIYVLNDYQPYKANPNFEVTDKNELLPGNAGADITIRTKGVRNTTDQLWEMKLNIKEAFLRINGKDITDYFADNNNVSNTPVIAFALNPDPQTGFKYDAANYQLYRDGAMVADQEIAHMKYTVTLKNGELLSRRFDVNFVNPFKSGEIKGVELAGNKIGGDSEDVKPSVLVVNKPALETEAPEDIYKWNTTTKALGLTDTGKNMYYLSEAADKLSVTYAFDENYGNYKEFKGQLVTGSTFEVDATTGVITFINLGTELQKECNARVIATVTFTDLSVVKVYIPVKVTLASK